MNKKDKEKALKQMQWATEKVEAQKI